MKWSATPKCNYKCRICSSVARFYHTARTLYAWCSLCKRTTENERVYEMARERQ